MCVCVSATDKGECANLYMCVGGGVECVDVYMAPCGWACYKMSTSYFIRVHVCVCVCVVGVCVVAGVWWMCEHVSAGVYVGVCVCVWEGGCVPCMNQFNVAICKKF